MLDTLTTGNLTKLLTVLVESNPTNPVRAQTCSMFINQVSYTPLTLHSPEQS